MRDASLRKGLRFYNYMCVLSLGQEVFKGDRRMERFTEGKDEKKEREDEKRLPIDEISLCPTYSNLLRLSSRFSTNLLFLFLYLSVPFPLFFAPAFPFQFFISYCLLPLYRVTRPTPLLFVYLQLVPWHLTRMEFPFDRSELVPEDSKELGWKQREKQWTSNLQKLLVPPPDGLYPRSYHLLDYWLSFNRRRPL